MIDMHDVMGKLSKKRKIFHSEADFQLALAREIESIYPSAKIVLEGQPLTFIHDEKGDDNDDNYNSNKLKKAIDISFWLENRLYIIELKYMKATIEAEIDGKRFKLKYPDENQNCRDYFYRDILRIENAVNSHSIECGFAILLTNYQPFWDKDHKLNGYKKPKLDWNKYPAFKVYDGATIPKKNEWHDSAKDLRKRDSVEFGGEYPVHWADYSTIETQNCISHSENSVFKYLLIHIPSDPLVG